MRAGPRNLITDVPGLRVGNARDDAARTGVTVLTGDRPFVAGVDIRGGSPGTREVGLLAPEKLVSAVDALVLSGGSAFGLDAASGVVEGLAAAGRGFAVGDVRVPIVPAAILFDLVNGGDKGAVARQYRGLGAEALAAASEVFEIGSEGAGTGANTADLKGGLGSASTVLEDGTVVGALVAVNAVGSVRVPGRDAFWAWPWEVEGEFGGLPPPGPPVGEAPVKPWPAQAAEAPRNTTIAIVATSAALDKPGATRLAVAAQDGLARAIQPSHSLRDGDLVFAVATGQGPPAPLPLAEAVGAAAATTLARAVARGVYAARSEAGDLRAAWSAR